MSEPLPGEYSRSGVVSGAAREAGPRVLILGASHTVGTFGKKLAELAAALPGARVTVRAIASSAPRHWTKGAQRMGPGFYERDADGAERRGGGFVPVPAFAGLAASFEPDVVVLALGTNPAQRTPLPATTDEIEKAVLAGAEPLARAAAARGRCFWVSPPRMRRFSDKELEKRCASLKAAAEAAGCRFIDSRAYTKPEDQDAMGIHYSPASPIPAAWARGVFGEMRASL